MSLLSSIARLLPVVVFSVVQKYCFSMKIENICLRKDVVNSPYIGSDCPNVSPKLIVLLAAILYHITDSSEIYTGLNVSIWCCLFVLSFPFNTMVHNMGLSLPGQLEPRGVMRV